MTLLLQVSDPHFGTERSAVVEALVRLALTLKPQVLLMSGDITQRATRAQFAAAQTFVQRLAVPHCVAVPGNHDIPLWHLPLRLLKPYARYSAAFGAELEPSLEADDLLLLAVNTTRWWRQADGQLSAAQVDRVTQRLAQARPGQRRLVVVHQPLVVTRPEDEKNRLHGHAAALQAWGAAGVDLIIGGHIHLPFVLPLTGGGWAVQAGTAVSRRVRAGAGNSVNLIHIDAAAAERAVVERWDHDPAQGGFVPRERHRLLALARHGED
ncbi:metallophosphoesterase [Ideonella sp. A 288]|uniref:metallophosphoesterase family protein n=1 Tax=Ideonella sp. A 288 TaxID=1962181 RepID=UPI000B4A7F8A|nr:metallophosphoesterase [Ideonella sp. A 288]